MADHIRYDLLTQQALRGVVKTVLTDAVKKGLPGEHHFYISFDTRADGVKLSQRLRAQYPEEMTIILQHQFWDLEVGDEGFDVGLSFGGVPERLHVPFEAIKGFFDPSVQFGLQFEEVTEGGQDNASPPGAIEATTVGKKKRRPGPQRAGTPVPTVANPQEPPPKAEPAGKPEEPPSPPNRGGAEVVPLDRFRKK
ncbi:MAG: hypothetical protein JO205_05700 [Pseudolabrys sp.]|nr:hypothetical protein [Pseudolabrys sp.]